MAFLTIRVQESIMRILLTSMVVFSCSLFIVHGGEPSKDLDRFQGTWSVQSLTEEGKAVPKEEIADLEVAIVKDMFTVSEKGKVIAQFQIKLDPSKTPRAIDLTHLIGKEKGMIEKGIYVVEKDMLKFCVDEKMKGRPASFDQKDTAACSVIVMQRKPGKDAK